MYYCKELDLYLDISKISYISSIYNDDDCDNYLFRIFIDGRQLDIGNDKNKSRVEEIRAKIVNQFEEIIN